MDEPITLSRLIDAENMQVPLMPDFEIFRRQLLLLRGAATFLAARQLNSDFLLATFSDQGIESLCKMLF